MKTSIKHLSDTKVEVTINVAVEALDDARKVALAKLAKDVKITGFRKGKAPISAVEKNIDEHLLSDEILNNAISKSIAKVFIDEDLRALDRPVVDIKKFVPGSELEFTATVEILPEVKLGNYKKLKAKLGVARVEDKDVNEVIERMRAGVAEKVAVERVAKHGDETVIDFVGKKDGVAFDGGTGSDYTLVLGSNSFIPGFEDGIVGKKAGETFDLDLTFPEDYHAADLKGAKVTFTTTLKEVKEPKLAELNDEFASKMGPFKTIAEMKADIKKELLAQKEREAKELLKEELVQQLIDASVVPVPEILVADQSQSIEQDFAQNLMYRGLSVEQYLESKGFKDKADWEENEIKPAAVKRVKAGLVLAELSKAENIEASEAEIAEHIELYKKQYGSNKEALAQFETPEVQRDIANRLVTEKTVDRLVEINS